VLSHPLGVPRETLRKSRLEAAQKFLRTRARMEVESGQRGSKSLIASLFWGRKGGQNAKT